MFDPYSGLSFSMHGFITLSDAMSYSKFNIEMDTKTLTMFKLLCLIVFITAGC